MIDIDKFRAYNIDQSIWFYNDVSSSPDVHIPELQKNFFRLASGFSTKECPNDLFNEICHNMMQEFEKNACFRYNLIHLELKMCHAMVL